MSGAGEAARGLGGRDALAAYRVQRIAARARLRADLRAGHAALRAGRGATDAPAPAMMADDPVPEPESIFAALVGAAEALPEPEPEMQAEPEPVAVVEAAPEPEPAAEVALEPGPVVEAVPEPEPPAPSRAEDDLSALECLGPGMRVRLRHLGYSSLGDLAAADAVRLRGELGEISRLLRVERWIEEARARLAG